MHAVAVLILAATLALAGCGRPQAAEQPVPTPQKEVEPGRAVAIMESARHIPVGSSHEPYSTDPPTSGPHYDIPAKPGFFDKAPPDEQLVHNLEHGYVIIWFKADDLDATARASLIAKIKNVLATADDSVYTRSPKLIAVPRPKLKVRIALTSWGHILELDSFDQAQIGRFIKFYLDTAPENQSP